MYTCVSSIQRSLGCFTIKNTVKFIIIASNNYYYSIHQNSISYIRNSNVVLVHSYKTITTMQHQQQQQQEQQDASTSIRIPIHESSNNDLMKHTTTTCDDNNDDSSSMIHHPLNEVQIMIKEEQQTPSIYILGAGSIGLLLSSMIRCTYPSYPIKLLLHNTSSLLVSIHNQQSEQSQSQLLVVDDTTMTTGTHHRKENMIHVCLQQAYTTIPSSSLTSHNNNSNSDKNNSNQNILRRQHHRSNNMNRSPRIIPIPYEILTKTSTMNNLQQRYKNNEYCIFLTTKAYQAMDAIQFMIENHPLFTTTSSNETDKQSSSPSPTISIIVFCNGALAIVEMIQEYIVKQQQQQQQHQQHNTTTNALLHNIKLYYAITTHGVYRESIIQSNNANNNNDHYNMNDHQNNNNSNNNIDTTEPSFCHLMHAGYGNIIVQDCIAIADILNTSGLNCTSIPTLSVCNTNHNLYDTNNIQFLLWKKLAVNCIINPFTVLYQCRNGELYNQVPNFCNDYIQPIINEIVQLYITICKNNNNNNKNDNTVSIDSDAELTVNKDTTIDTSINDDDEIQKKIYTLMYDYVISVIDNTSMNYSSTYQDVFHNNIQQNNNTSTTTNTTTTNSTTTKKIIHTEIPYFNGYIIHKSKQYNVSCPMNTKIYALFQERIHTLT